MNDNKNIVGKDALPKIELRNREMTDLLGDAPVWLIHTGSYLLYGVLSILLLGASFISYPDVVKEQALIEDRANVNWITVNSSGQIESIFVRDDSIVKRGDTIGIIQNPARLNDVKGFCRTLANVERYYLTNNTDLLREFPFDLVMGEMSDAYETFTKAVRTCLIYDDYNYFLQRKAFLQKELDVLKKESEKNELAILRVEREIFELSVSHKREIAKNKELLELAYENMTNSVRRWESKYLIRSHSDGRVVLGETRMLMRMVNIGDTVCSIISDNNEDFTARIQLTQEQVTGVETGNTVNISLSKYPSHTYGHLTGEISSISFVPYNKMYVIDIELPDKLTTTVHKEIKYELGLRGEAEIITSSRSVLSRIFTPIYNLFMSGVKL
jgi:multidrug resistance efflux pump